MSCRLGDGGLHHLRHLFFHIRDRSRHLDLAIARDLRGSARTGELNPVYLVLGAPLLAAALLALVPGRFQILAGKRNARLPLNTLLAGCSLFFLRPAPTRLIFIDDFNIYSWC
jgi:hypothetical protein